MNPPQENDHEREDYIRFRLSQDIYPAVMLFGLVSGIVYFVLTIISLIQQLQLSI